MCEYPIKILPKKQYVKCINIDDLCAQCKRAVLVRRIDCDELPFHYIGGYKVLNEGIINDDVLEWSTNLLGGDFDIKDICWRQFGKGIEEWNEGDVNICDYSGSYEQIKSVNYVSIYLCRFHNKNIPYKRKFGSRKDLEQYTEKTKELNKDIIEHWSSENEFDCIATITIVHKPTMLNYWHMTIEIRPHDFESSVPRDSKKNKSLKKRIKEALHMYILNNVVCEEIHNIEQIPESLYMK